LARQVTHVFAVLLWRTTGRGRARRRAADARRLALAATAVPAVLLADAAVKHRRRRRVQGQQEQRDAGGAVDAFQRGQLRQVDQLDGDPGARRRADARRPADRLG
jgi:hypothetical protein